jgi:hypothetical protein
MQTALQFRDTLLFQIIEIVQQLKAMGVFHLFGFLDFVDDARRTGEIDPDSIVDEDFFLFALEGALVDETPKSDGFGRVLHGEPFGEEPKFPWADHKVIDLRAGESE